MAQGYFKLEVRIFQAKEPADPSASVPRVPAVAAPSTLVLFSHSKTKENGRVLPLSELGFQVDIGEVKPKIPTPGRALRTIFFEQKSTKRATDVLRCVGGRLWACSTSCAASRGNPEDGCAAWSIQAIQEGSSRAEVKYKQARLQVQGMSRACKNLCAEGDSL